jgi:hypothetical protein
MSSSEQAGGREDQVVTDAGSNTDQHITGVPETGSFVTDEAPSADTPAHGSTNAGINATGANRPGAFDETTGGRDDS